MESGREPHQESWPSNVVESVNKENLNFNRNVGFVCAKTKCIVAPKKQPIDIEDMSAYLKVASEVIASGVPNYKAVRVPLNSTFNLQYIEENIGDYHDKLLLDYLTFGFPLGINHSTTIKNNANDNHASARAFPTEVNQYVQSELEAGALAGPFSQPPHELFTWSPLMTRPKDVGRRVILDLYFGDFSVNKATSTDHYDRTLFA